jgi:asparagine synthase (glutamine-hydrolysing)
LSAICGIINFNGEAISGEITAEMMLKLKKYPFDDFGTYSKGKVFLGNIHKYTTEESKLDRLPFLHKTAGLVIVADAIIDNRKELYSEFNIGTSEGCRISDSELIIMAYIKWGQNCPEHLVGDFAFVIWNEKRKELFCARDHVGRKTFYFYFSSGIFAFCTVIKPLLYVKKDPNALNDAWIANFLALQGPIQEVNCDDTIYEEIQQLLPAHSMKLSTTEMLKKQYWYPLKVKPLKLNSDKEYEEAFMEVFKESINCRLRSVGSVGMMLSGGLDSGSIACLAAKELDRTGLRLKAFSSVPYTDYKDWLPSYSLADEREYVRAVVESVNNIDINYCACEGINSYNSIDELTNIMEQPYKFVQNAFWINEISSKASKEGCSILLGGQFGNYSISFGDVIRYLITLYRSGRWISFAKTIKEYSDFHSLNYKRVVKDFSKIVLPRSLKKTYNILHGRE